MTETGNCEGHNDDNGTINDDNEEHCGVCGILKLMKLKNGLAVMFVECGHEGGAMRGVRLEILPGSRGLRLRVYPPNSPPCPHGGRWGKKTLNKFYPFVI